MANEQLIQGGRQLDDLLKTLPKKLERNVMRAALREGGVVMRNEVKSRVPVDDGDLRRSVRVSTRSRKGEVYASVKAGNKKAYYAGMVEFGTRPHLVKVDDRDRGINNRTGRRVSVTTINRQQRSLIIGRTFVGPTVSHPGARPHPFMRPAADAAFGPAIKAFERKLRERMTAAGLNVPAPAPDDPEP